MTPVYAARENMVNKKAILDTELKYASEFSSSVEDKQLIRFKNPALPDMYYHNFTFVLPINSIEQLLRIISDELSNSISLHAEFLTVILYQRISQDLLAKLPIQPDVSYSGYYAFDTSKFCGFPASGKGVVSKVDSISSVRDVAAVKIEQYGADGKEAFWSRVTEEKGRIYLSNSTLNSYVCYSDQGKPIGCCDLYINGTIAKIEDFDVITSEQRKGYGTTILNTLISDALAQGVKTIYLITDQDDTVKKMYQKLKFFEFHEQTDLFWNFKSSV